jgi:glutathione S-transferase
VADVSKKLDWIDERLGAGPFLMGSTLTLPDPYLFVITNWTDKFIGLDPWPNLRAFRDRMLDRPSVRHVLRFEGLLEEQPAG